MLQVSHRQLNILLSLSLHGQLQRLKKYLRQTDQDFSNTSLDLPSDQPTEIQQQHDRFHRKRGQTLAGEPSILTISRILQAS